MNKKKMLDAVSMEIEHCEICRVGKIGQAVPGEGNPDADIVFIGEAPGKTEAKTGKPFVGRSGQLLRKMIREIGLDDEKDIYITSPVKYLPERGTPSPADVAHGKKHLDKQLSIIDPKIIVLLGRVATLGVLGEKISVKSRHGEVIEKDLSSSSGQAGKKYFITLHPAAVLRFPPLKKIVDEDFHLLQRLIFHYSAVDIL